MTAIRHIGLVVADLERSINFYSSVFGFKLAARTLESGDYIEKLVGLPAVRLEWAKLADSNGMMLELLRYHSHPDTPYKPPVQRHGCSHVALTVQSIDQSLRLLEAAGGTAGPVQQNPENTVRVVYARDPEGVLLELVEMLSIP